MSKMHFLKLCLPATGLLLALFAGAPAQERQSTRRPAEGVGQIGEGVAPPKRAPGQGQAQEKEEEPNATVNETIVQCPTYEAMRTAWKVHWMTTNGFGLVLQGAWFKKGPREPWFQVLGDARLSEMLVPYHSGSPRFWDVSYNFSLINLSRDEAGPHGKLLGVPPLVCQEIRDRGIAWVDGVKGGRRGQTMVLWGCLNAANYRYLIEYGFQDDGTI